MRTILTVIQTNEIVKVVSRTRANAEIIFLGDGILLREYALFRLIVKLDRAAEVPEQSERLENIQLIIHRNCILFRSQAKRLTLFQRHVVENLHLERSTEAFVLLLDVHHEPIAASFRVQAGILQVVRVWIVLQQFRMGAAREATHRAAAERRVVVRGPAHERELVQALVLAVGTVGGRHLLDVGHGQLEFLSGVALEHVPAAGTLTVGSAR